MSTIGIERAGEGEEACWLEGVVHVVCWFMLVCLLLGQAVIFRSKSV